MLDAKSAAAARDRNGPQLSVTARADGSAKGLSNPLDIGSYGTAWLVAQCGRIRSVSAAVLVVPSRGGGERTVTSWPTADIAEKARLVGLAERALAERKIIVMPLREESVDGSAPERRAQSAMAMGVQLGFGEVPIGAIAVALAPSTPQAPDLNLSMIAEDLRWGAGWLEALPWVQRATVAATDLEKAAACLDVLAACGEQTTMVGTAMAIANEIAIRFNCGRVSVGRIYQDGSIRLLATSNAAMFHSNAKAVSAIEAAMEEACEQSATVSYPPPASDDRRVTLAQEALAFQADDPAASVLSIAIADAGGRVIGAITLERHSGPAFESAAVQVCEAVGALVGPPLSLHLRAHRLVSGRLVDGAHSGLEALLGPRRPVLKLLAALLAAMVMVLALAKGEHRVTARAVLEPEIQRVITAPFDGYIAAAPVRAGDAVRSGQLLAELDDRDLLIDRAKWTAERDKLVQRQREALAKYDRNALAVLEPQHQQALSQLALIEERLRRTRIPAPFDGVVVAGDLSQSLGTPIEKGKILFEIAPLDAYRLIMHVDERDIAFVASGQKGQVALSGLPASPLPVEVSRITPVTVAEDGRNSFKVEAKLGELDHRMRPGLEGVAKIDTGRRAYLWIWSRPLMDWMRIAAWKYLP